ncbi:head assembly cofactor [Biomphalaria pfeifferi]|uniref:Head assembly cofactor n=1 Tax=Biomphalaria pfeifferi TaxID=112525 RepID=A0AAD8APA6_BIOPF|nr:head assembly cofactor [Biomphalaria pfeifferi]
MHTEQVTLDNSQLLELIRYDCELFLSFYLGPELTLEVPEFHKELWDEFLELLDQVNDPNRLTGILKKLLGVPREHAKTTLVKLAIVLLLRYSRLSFCAYVSNTHSAALNAVKDIKLFFESENDTKLYGKTKLLKSSETDGFFILQIPLADGSLKTVILRAFGQGTQIRGTLILNRRPDILIFDDVESHETAGSAMQQAKIDSWCLGTALKSMAKLGICIFIGNMITDTTLLARLSKEPEWSPTVFGAIVKRNGELRPLWEGRWTLDGLFADYASFRRLGSGHVWEAEMMNLTAKDLFGTNFDDVIKLPTPMPEQIECGFIALDPAFGENAWNDESAITVHVRLWGMDIPMLIDSVHGRWREERIFDEMLALTYRWGLSTWVIESQAAQKLLITLFRQYMVMRHMSPEAFILIPLLAGKESKYSRIVAFREAIATGSYAISEDLPDLITKLDNYQIAVEHDDEEDSASFGTQVWKLHEAIIKDQGRQDVAGRLFGIPDNGKDLSALDMGL